MAKRATKQQSDPRPEPVRLTFARLGHLSHADENVALNLSAVAGLGRTLWLASDEFSHVDRLTNNGKGGYGSHKAFAIGDFIELPDGPEAEMDIEGLALDGGFLWIVGSHSKTRKKPKAEEHDPQDVLARLEDVSTEANRCFLGRVPLGEGKGGLPALVSRGDGDAQPAALASDAKRGNALLKRLRKDDLIAPFIGLPAKENGFDIEGLAVRGERVFLGLRGPVLRGWAVALELRVEEKKPGQLRLGRFADGARYRRHLLDLDGLGIRDLAWHGDDLLVLSGPTMDIDGPVQLRRWREPLRGDAVRVLPRDSLPLVLDLPFGHGDDHPEGIMVLDDGDAPAVLVVYDSPAKARLEEGGRIVVADRFPLPL